MAGRVSFGMRPGAARAVGIAAVVGVGISCYAAKPQAAGAGPQAAAPPAVRILAIHGSNADAIQAPRPSGRQPSVAAALSLLVCKPFSCVHGCASNRQPERGRDIRGLLSNRRARVRVRKPQGWA